MFSLLDAIFNCEVITDLILGFVPLRLLHYEAHDTKRIYRKVRGFAGLHEPMRLFKHSVWLDRITHPDSSDGVRLHGLRILQLDGGERIEALGRPVPTRSDLLLQIFEALHMPSHALCNRGIRSLLSEEDEIENEEIGYLLDHFGNTWLPRFSEYFREGTVNSMARTGLGDMIGLLISAICVRPEFAALFLPSVEWIVYNLDHDSGHRFKKLVFTPYAQKFEQVFIKLESADEPRENREHLRVKLRKYLFSYDFCSN